MATRQGNRDDPGQGLALCDFELAARLHEALVGDERQPPGDAIAALLREALCSAEACFVWAEQLAEVGGVWAELFSAARTRGRLAHCRATPGNRHPDHLALPVLCGEQLLALVGVGGAAGGTIVSPCDGLPAWLSCLPACCRHVRVRSRVLLHWP